MITFELIVRFAVVEFADNNAYAAFEMSELYMTACLNALNV